MYTSAFDHSPESLRKANLAVKQALKKQAEKKAEKAEQGTQETETPPADVHNNTVNAAINIYDKNQNGVLEASEAETLKNDLHKFSNPLEIALNVFGSINEVLAQTSATLNEHEKELVNQLRLTA